MLSRIHFADADAATSDVEHPLALTHEERQGLFDVDILAGSAGHHGLQGMPVVRSGDDDGLDLLTVEQPAKVAKPLGSTAADLPERYIKSAAMHLGDGRQVGFLLFLKIEEVALANETVADEPDADALIRAHDAFPACRRQQP